MKVIFEFTIGVNGVPQVHLSLKSPSIDKEKGLLERASSILVFRSDKKLEA